MSSSIISFYKSKTEQNLIKNLCTENIHLFGMDVIYIPRIDGENYDLFVGEDPLAKFEDYVEIEAQVTNISGWGGQGDIISKFSSLVLTDKITFTISRSYWKSKINTSSPNSVILSGKVSSTVNNKTITGTNTLFVNSLSKYDSIRIDAQYYTVNTISNNTSLKVEEVGVYSNSNTDIYLMNRILPIRPRENDMIWFPIAKKLFNILFVEHENVYYPLGSLLTFDLTCELFDYTSERIDTGVEDIDIIGDLFTSDMATLANTDAFVIEDHDETAQNKMIQDNANSLIITTTDQRKGIKGV